jgi:DnaJ-class molecular chaperone
MGKKTRSDDFCRACSGTGSVHHTYEVEENGKLVPKKDEYTCPQCRGRGKLT